MNKVKQRKTQLRVNKQWPYNLERLSWRFEYAFAASSLVKIASTNLLLFFLHQKPLEILDWVLDFGTLLRYEFRNM